MSSLQVALEKIREKTTDNNTERGKAFERLVKVFLENDPTQEQQYSKVWHYADWAKEHPEYPQHDTGIDLVAKLRDEEGFCAIQCKFRQEDASITKSEIDSFISASSSPDFTRRVLINTTNKPTAQNVKATIENLEKEFSCISLDELNKSSINWAVYIRDEKVSLMKKELRSDQEEALEKVREGLAENDRGKMIMACGIGKTLTSLRIAEDIAGAGKLVLYMVPSISLMSQAIREWKNDAIRGITAFSVCSDAKVGRRKPSDDGIEISLTDLALPATTNAERLSEKVVKADKSKMTVIFATYHSIDVIIESQKEYDLGSFDLIVCDEAHRTTGATFEEDKSKDEEENKNNESNFVKIHDEEKVRGRKRLYMTATPRIYGEAAKKKEREGVVTLASMDDEDMFGKTLVNRSFGWAVENNLLADYKVVVLVMDEQVVSDRIQKALAEGPELKLDDATKMVGCYKALAKIGMEESFYDGSDDGKPMKRALAFCSNISRSKLFRCQFKKVTEAYIEWEREHAEKEGALNEHKTELSVEASHVDGTFNAQRRTDELDWLQEDTEENTCRVLSNARCLSEGVDVPTLDAVIFLHPRKSQIDVVQAVGRVMRKAEEKGKKWGYVILPVAVASGVSAEKALDENERYKVIWQILNALRSHDERLDNKINQLELGGGISDRIEIVVEDVLKKSEPKNGNKINIGEGSDSSDSDAVAEEVTEQEQLVLFANLSQAIKAKIVEKCGTREYWNKWTTDIAEIAKKHTTRINSIIDSEAPAQKAFSQFLKEIKDNLNPNISKKDAVIMLAQHIITRPVFNALFQGNQFTSENAVSKAMENVLSQIYERNIEAESKTLEKFYDTIKQQTDGIPAEGKQKLIKNLYEDFFQNAFGEIAHKLGIVYTPVEVVDFIIHSVEDVMRDEFDSSLGNSDVDILDPFAGTGTFICRLLQSEILSKEQIRRKFTAEIHANEIMLLAYYIACVNIEAVYSELVEEEQYRPFGGMVLADTFRLDQAKQRDIEDILSDNSDRKTRQTERNIKVIIGNPPYSRGQGPASDSAANKEYRDFNGRIKDTYAKESSAKLQNPLYDSYIKAFRWASDRIGNEGVIGFVTNAGWIDGNAMDGFRKCLGREFNKIYVFNLRGGIRGLSGDLANKEGGNVFGIMAGVAVVILVKSKNSIEKGKIYFCNINDGLSKEQKLEKIKNLKSIKKIQEENEFDIIRPDEYNDWINQRDKSFNKHLLMGDKSGKEKTTIFETYSNGAITNCDAWLYNSSKSQLQETIRNLVDTYNEEMEKYQKSGGGIPVEKFVNKDPKQIGWHRALFKKAARGDEAIFKPDNFINSLYRPFNKQVFYYEKHFPAGLSLLPLIFKNEDAKNIVIGVAGVGSKQFSCLATDRVPCIDFIEKSQCFPLYLADKNKSEGAKLITSVGSDATGLRDAINPEIIKEIRQSLGHEQINSKMLFQYIYAVLHSQEYRNRYANNLSRELPRIPIVKSNQKFFDFVEAGEKLIRLHVDYEEADMYPVNFKGGDPRFLNIPNTKLHYRVTKMKFLNRTNKSTVIYNNNITIQNIPPEAYEYVINQRSALELVMERQCVKVDKKTGIKNDANDYANEIMGNPLYPLELFQRVITVSLETMKIVRSLPGLDID